VSPNTFKANVRFPRAGLYEVEIAGFDPRDPARLSRIGPAVYIQPRPLAPAAASTSGALWLWAIVGGSVVTALLAAAWNTKRAPMRATR
jgi:hypothetical protein